MDEWQERRRKEEEASKKDRYGCIIGEEQWNPNLHRCVKLARIGEQIPAQPIVPVGPVTIEQKVAALNDEVAQIKKELAFIYGALGIKFTDFK